MRFVCAWTVQGASCQSKRDGMKRSGSGQRPRVNTYMSDKPCCECTWPSSSRPSCFCPSCAGRVGSRPIQAQPRAEDRQRVLGGPLGPVVPDVLATPLRYVRGFSAVALSAKNRHISTRRTSAKVAPISLSRRARVRARKVLLPPRARTQSTKFCFPLAVLPPPPLHLKSKVIKGSYRNGI